MRTKSILAICLMLVLMLSMVNIGTLAKDVEEAERSANSQLLDSFIEEALRRTENPDEYRLSEDEAIGNVVERERYVQVRSINDFDVVKGSLMEGADNASGAHYYAFSPASTDYSYAAGLFELPASFNLTTNTDVVYNSRTAYLSGGFLGTGYGIDIGIRNNGGNWHPYFYDDSTGNFVTFDNETNGDYEADSSAVIAAFFIMPYSETEIFSYITFYDAQDEVVIDFTKLIPIGENNVYFINEQAYGRFYRFVSLVQPDYTVGNMNDGTYMYDAGISELRIRRHSGGVEDWGITTDNVQNVWEAHPGKIDLEYTATTETVSITHSNE